MASVKFFDRNDHCVAVIRIAMPGTSAVAEVGALGEDKADALARASSLAHRIATDPVMSALMPPQARAAVMAARGLAAAAKRGLPTLKHFWGRLQGPGKKRLARALMEEAAAKQTTGALDVGWNPFKRKKKRAAPRRSSPPPRMREAPESEEQEQGEQPDEEYGGEQ
jgi:hypothetical protein